MKYVLPTMLNLYSYIILVNMNCQISMCLTTGTGFISTKLILFFVVDPDAALLRECPWRTIRALLFKLSSFVIVSDIILLLLSEFHVTM